MIVVRREVKRNAELADYTLNICRQGEQFVNMHTCQFCCSHSRYQPFKIPMCMKTLSMRVSEFPERNLAPLRVLLRKLQTAFVSSPTNCSCEACDHGLFRLS